MNCPKDSDYYWTTIHEANTCQSHIDRNTNPEIVMNFSISRTGKNKCWCTRRKNHKGKHHCHHNTGKCARTWTTEEEIIEAL